MKPVDPRLVRYARAARGYFAASALIGLVQTVVIVAFAWLLTDAVTGAIAGRDITRTLLWLIAVVALRGALIALSDAAGSRAAARTGSELRASLIAAVGKLGPAWLSQRNQAALAVTAGHGLDALDAYFGRYIPQLVLTVITTPVVVAVMFWQDWPSAVIAMVTLPLIPLFLILIGLATRGVQRRQWQTLQRMAARFADSVEGLSTLRLFGREQRAADRIEADAEQYRRETMKVLRYSFLSGFSMELLSSLAVALIAVAVGFRLLTGDLSLEVGLFVLLLAPEAFLPIRQVGVQFHAATEGVAATEDIFEVLDAAEEASDAPRFVSPSARSTSGIETRSLSEERSDETKRNTPEPLSLADIRVHRGDTLLPAISLTVAPGEITLLEGPSGSGKSSILAALRGAAEFEGEALLGGGSIRSLDPSEWIAWAGQTPGLLRGTIADNVALGATDADPEAIREALTAAGAEELDPAQELGVQGSGLSGGQAQRVAVARALYWQSRDPRRILMLDEPSSALDADTEARLWQSLRARADAGAAILLVSHRCSARDIADHTVNMAVSA